MRTLKELIDQGQSAFPPTANAIRRYGELQKRIKLLESQHQDSRYIDTLRAEGRQALKLDLQAEILAERERVTKQVGILAERWEFDYQKNLNLNRFNLEREQLRLESLGEDELRAEAARYIERPDNRNPDAVRSFTVALKRAGEDELQANLRDAAGRSHALTPWMRGPIGEKLETEAKAYSDVSGDSMPLLIDGKIAMVGWQDIDDAAESSIPEEAAL